MDRRTFTAGVAASLAAPMLHAQQLPTQPVRILVGFAPGGGTDILARVIGQKLAERKNKYGNRLLKMVYVQIGFGKHKDFVQAYRWLDEEMKAGHGFARLDLEKTMGKLTALMTPEQLAQARGEK